MGGKGVVEKDLYSVEIVDGQGRAVQVKEEGGRGSRGKIPKKVGTLLRIVKS